MSARAIRLEPSFREKIWGSQALSPWFPDPAEKIGEVWFSQEADAPLLLKFIFTTERLSVQVHPNDEYARRVEHSAGKTEMWHILRADPGATIALGFRKPLSPERLREASLSGEIETLLDWVPVKPGETYFVCAGMVHAIGAGIALAEIQQFSDITYRLYDYGRPRELHLDRAIEVTRMDPHHGAAQPLPMTDGVERLVACPYFVTDRIAIDGPELFRTAAPSSEFWIVTDGAGTIDGEPFREGEVWQAPAGGYELNGNATILRTYYPR
ncbi:MAG: class I mannose-6-phosphate isomerase [Bryobacteraceae bacterium]